MTETDLDYYERRTREEVEAAASATCPEAASVHRALAAGYESKASDCRRVSQQLPGPGRHGGTPTVGSEGR